MWIVCVPCLWQVNYYNYSIWNNYFVGKTVFLRDTLLEKGRHAVNDFYRNRSFMSFEDLEKQLTLTDQEFPAEEQCRGFFGLKRNAMNKCIHN